MTKKSFFVAAAVLLLIAGVIIGCMLLSGEKETRKNISKIDPDALPVNIRTASYAYDISDKRVAVGAADYVFVGQVLRREGVTYEDPVPMELEDGSMVEVGNPYTHYTVQVLENMKGTLRTEKPIEIVKDGGAAQDGKAVYLYEKDCLPQTGKVYLFLAYTQEDGSLLISGMNSNIPIDVEKNSSKQVVKNADIYQEYKTAIKNEIVPKGCQRDVSIYDKKE